MNSYRDKVKKILAATGWSQETLAGKVGVSFVTLNAWVNGKSEPRDKMKVRIDEVYAYALGGEGVDKEELSELKRRAVGRKFGVRKMLENRRLLDKVTVGFTFHSNGTEGSTMTESDVAEVLFDNKILANRTAREQREAINHQVALDFLLDELYRKGKDFRVSKDLVLAVHLRLMNGIVSDAGLWRNHGVRIQGSRVSVANFIKIPELVERVVNEMNAETTDPVGLLAQTHADFEQIHPFSDGNGRVGRLLMFAKALNLGLVPPIVRKERKEAYYKYLEAAQVDGRYDGLEGFVAEEILYSGEVMEG